MAINRDECISALLQWIVYPEKAMRLLITLSLVLVSLSLSAQKPCSATVYRQFDFWVGDWEAYGVKGKKAGDSRISIILDSCVVLEEWTSTGTVQGLRFAGKSFNTFNSNLNQWQQTWVDNTGGSTAYSRGRYESNRIIFETDPFPIAKDTMAVRRLTFFDLGREKVRQWGEISKDRGVTWITEYDLEYRRKNK